MKDMITAEDMIKRLGLEKKRNIMNIDYSKITNNSEVVERIENWWSANSVSKYSQLSVSMSKNNDITLRFGYWLPINLFDLKKVIGNDYSVSGHDISDGDKNEAVFYKVKKL